MGQWVDKCFQNQIKSFFETRNYCKPQFEQKTLIVSGQAYQTRYKSQRDFFLHYFNNFWRNRFCKFDYFLFIIYRFVIFHLRLKMRMLDFYSLITCIFQVANMLKHIPKGTSFVIRLVEPLKAGFGKLFFNLSFHQSIYLSLYQSVFEIIHFIFVSI